MKTITIPKTKIERLMSPDFHFRSGAGKGINGGVDACVMQAVDWLAGGKGDTDSPECASPAIRRYCIRLNDSWLFKDHRDELKPFAPRIVNTNNPKLEKKRLYIAADYACRVFVPIWMEAAGKKYWADKLHALPKLKDEKTAANARQMVQEARKDADAAAAYAADAAAAYAAAYAHAAYAADAHAAYAADAAAANAADAAYADYADAEKKGIAPVLRAATLECLDKMIKAK